MVDRFPSSRALAVGALMLIVVVTAAACGRLLKQPGPVEDSRPMFFGVTPTTLYFCSPEPPATGEPNPLVGVIDLSSSRDTTLGISEVFYFYYKDVPASLHVEAPGPITGGVADQGQFRVFARERIDEAVSFTVEVQRVTRTGDTSGEKTVTNRYVTITVVPQCSVLFASHVDGDLEIFTKDPGSLEQTRLTTNTWDDLDPVRSPDGRQIAYLSNAHDPQIGAYDIYTMNADGTIAARRTFLGIGEVTLADPAWSPDGRYIAFAIPTPGAAGIFTLDLQTSIVDQYTTTIGDGAPTWSPDGTQIAFERDGDLYLIDVDPITPNERPLLADPAYDGDPAWSDDDRIAFVREGDIHVLDVFTNTLTPLVETIGTYESAPVWSPNGGSIAYQRLVPLAPASSIRIFEIATATDTPLGTGGPEQDPDW